MAPRIPNPKLTLPKRGRSTKADEPSAPVAEKTTSKSTKGFRIPNPKLSLPKRGRSAKADEPSAPVAEKTTSKSTKGFRIPNPKLSLPKRGRSAKADEPSAPLADESTTAAPATLEMPPPSGPPVSELPAPVAASAPPAARRRGLPRLAMPNFNARSLSLPRLGGRGGGSMSRGRPERDVVGLDIEPGYIVAAQASANGSVKVVRAVGAPLDMEVVRDGEVLDPQALGEALAELFRGSGLGRTVRVGLANQRTVLRTIDLPPIEDRKDLATAVRFQAEEEVPMPLNNAVLDFQPLGLVDTPQGQRQRVVLVAAQRDMVERLLQALQIAGLRPVGVDLSAFAMIRALYRSDGERGPNLVYLGVGGLTNMAVADGITCKFTRVLGGGLESMAESLAARREIPVNEARDLLFRVGLPEDDDSHLAYGGQHDTAGSAPSVEPEGYEEYDEHAHYADETQDYEGYAEHEPYADAPQGYADHDPHGDAPDAYADHDPHADAPQAYADRDADPDAPQVYPDHAPHDDAPDVPGAADAGPDEVADAGEDEVQFHTFGAGAPEAGEPEVQFHTYGAADAGHDDAAEAGEDEVQFHTFGAGAADAGPEDAPEAGEPEVQFHTYGAADAGHDDAAEAGEDEVQFHTFGAGAADAGPDDAPEAGEPEVQFHTYGAADAGHDDAAEAGEDEVQFHTFGAGAADAGHDDAPEAGAGEVHGQEDVQLHGEAADPDDPAHPAAGDDAGYGPYATDASYSYEHGAEPDPHAAVPAEHAPDEAVTRELPAYDYEEPPPFDDDYTFEAQSPAVAAGGAPEPAAGMAYPGPDPYRQPSRESGPDDDVHTVISDGVREIAGEVRNSLDFQRIQAGGEAVQGIVLSGPVLDVPGFAGALERELGLPVYRGELDMPAGAVSGPVSRSRVAVAAGLAVEEIAP